MPASVCKEEKDQRGGEQRKEKVKKRARGHERKQGQLQPIGR